MKLLNISEASRRLGISRGTVYSAIKKGQIKAVKLSLNTFIPEAEVERILRPSGDQHQ